MSFDVYSHGALTPERHERLVADLEGYAADAGIKPNFIYQTLPDYIKTRERNYLKGFRTTMHEGTTGGLYYTGVFKAPSIQDRMAAMAGCLVRNFIRARVVSLGDVIDSIAAKDPIEGTCLLIPNFYYGQQDLPVLAKWQVALMYDFLLSRQLRGLQTILYVNDIGKLSKEFGTGFAELIQGSFLEVKS